MTTKFISLATVIVLLDVSLRSQLSSSDPLFLFASSNFVVNAALLIMVGIMVGLSFRSKFRHWQSFLSCATAGALLILIGALGVFFSDTVHWFPGFLLPLDYLFILQAGIVFSLSALSYQHQKVPIQIQLPRPLIELPKLVFPVPKLPHSPTSSRTRRTQPA